METTLLGVLFMGMFMDTGTWGRGFTSALDHCDPMAGLWMVRNEV